MSNEYDHYQEAQDLIAMLRDLQLDNWACSLQFAIDNGSTGNEIFMALRWSIEKFINERQCTGIVLAKAKKLLEELDTSLR